MRQHTELWQTPARPPKPESASRRRRAHVRRCRRGRARPFADLSDFHLTRRGMRFRAGERPTPLAPPSSCPRAPTTTSIDPAAIRSEGLDFTVAQQLSSAPQASPESLTRLTTVSPRTRGRPRSGGLQYDCHVMRVDLLQNCFRGRVSRLTWLREALARQVFNLRAWTRADPRPNLNESTPFAEAAHTPGYFLLAGPPSTTCQSGTSERWPPSVQPFGHRLHSASVEKSGITTSPTVRRWSAFLFSARPLRLNTLM
jgi:hypothetical protein